MKKTLSNMETRLNDMPTAEQFGIQLDKVSAEMRTLSHRLNLLRDQQSWNSIGDKEWIVLAIVVITSVVTIGAQLLW